MGPIGIGLGDRTGWGATLGLESAGHRGDLRRGTTWDFPQIADGALAAVVLLGGIQFNVRWEGRGGRLYDCEKSNRG